MSQFTEEFDQEIDPESPHLYSYSLSQTPYHPHRSRMPLLGLKQTPGNEQLKNNLGNLLLHTHPTLHHNPHNPLDEPPPDSMHNPNNPQIHTLLPQNPEPTPLSHRTHHYHTYQHQSKGQHLSHQNREPLSPQVQWLSLQDPIDTLTKEQLNQLQGHLQAQNTETLHPQSPLIMTQTPMTHQDYTPSELHNMATNPKLPKPPNFNGEPDSYRTWKEHIKLYVTNTSSLSTDVQKITATLLFMGGQANKWRRAYMESHKDANDNFATTQTWFEFL
ncbi:hypothetical protein P691DRAFT_791848 [Macrolepiota fuliginosa MF-IS2]|uniref:Uncharacterized protein n=1 Tax=Macrolepiota fuliginosa MF-IS2 TaxID=1400762 RepID=A0A9P6BX74_9AGAR|nr:hypothetical protein P691DRAFT_791848 [Macrolepiota fuliginosa MF-IS2]